MNIENITCWEDILAGGKAEASDVSESRKPSYGGAYDIEDDQYFSKEELMDFTYALLDELEDETDKNLDIIDASINDNMLNIVLINTDSNTEFENKIKIDMRAIRKPKDLAKYIQPLKNLFIQSVAVEDEEDMDLIGESLDEGETHITRPQIKELNKICAKYCGWKHPKFIRNMWDELEAAGVGPILIQGYPNDVAEDGAKSWDVSYTYNGKDVMNSRFIYQVYEGNSDSPKNEYNIYFS